MTVATLFNAATGEEIGEINHGDFERIVKTLENQGQVIETNFYLDEDAIELLGAAGVDESATDLLHEALGDEDSIRINFEED